jgi:hypothetical protein
VGRNFEGEVGRKDYKKGGRNSTSTNETGMKAKKNVYTYMKFKDKREEGKDGIEIIK